MAALTHPPGVPPGQRLFLAVPLPAEVRPALAPLAAGLPGARWVRPEQLHLTLRFLGDTPPDLQRALVARLAAAGPWPRPQLGLQGPGVFPRTGPPRSLWLGVARTPELASLQARVEALVVDLGFPPEPRPFQPHLTLARLRGAPRGEVQAYLARHRGFRLGPLAVPAFGLYASRTLPEGSVHTLEAAFSLGPEP